MKPRKPPTSKKSRNVMMLICVRKGLIFDLCIKGITCVVAAPLADRIAQANGFQYAEQFVRAHTGKHLELDSAYKILPRA